MPDQTPNQDSDERSILDSDTPTDESAPTDEASSDVGPADPDHAASAPDDAAAAANDTPQVDNLHYEDDDLANKLRHASDEQLDNAPFGIIKVDDEGTVEFFNSYEAELSGMDPEEVEGRNFFTQVAPCTNNRLFRGRFKKGVRRDELDETFTYTYTYKMRPTLVDVHLYRDDAGNNWITVQKY
jgi:photoactive yellow protein